MSQHNWINKLAVIYAYSSDAKKKAIEEGVTENAVEIRQCMEDIMYKLDMLTKKLAETMNKEDSHG